MTALRRGFLWAALATVAYGVTTPLIAALGRGCGPWSSAGWLYLGAAAFAAAAIRRRTAIERGLRTGGLRLIAIAVIGGALAPAAFIAGLRDTGPLTASLALNLEAPFSAAIAVLAFGEHVSRRAGAALIAIVAGGSLLAWTTSGGGSSPAGASGIALVTAATALWAIDNALSARLAGLDPRVTVFWKAAIGAAVTLTIGELLGERRGNFTTCVSLLVIGAAGYGASLLCYLIAQRRFGIARTASVFAASPFVGAAAALGLGAAHWSGPGAIAFVVMLVGVWLHVTERHEHLHRHDAREHEHEHEHDRHHDHVHEHPVAGRHSHPHAHAVVIHSHEHAPDGEHTHAHAGTAARESPRSDHR